jgi:site-specific DNA-methyltransferase (adenine-specific)
VSVTILQGDCREQMRKLADASVDSAVTDPPYELTSARPGGRSPATEGAVMKGFMGMAWDGSGVAYDVEMWREVLRVLKPGGHLLAFGGSRTYHRMACAIEDAGFEIRDQIMWIYGSGFPKSRNLDGEHVGWGTALKPAHEPIVVARKPLAGTVAANMAGHGVGAINIDGCRIGTSKSVPTSAAKDRIGQIAKGNERGRSTESSGFDPKIGRWPANVLHDGSDEVIAAFPEAPGQIAPLSVQPGLKTSRVYGKMDRGGEASAERRYTDNGTTNFAALPGMRRNDTGSAARFFYCAKADKGDREEGCEDLPKRNAGQVSETSGQHITRRDEGYELPKRANTHPTVKPESLMRYLVRLVTPPGGLVLDPFTGSGSTGKAAILEGFRFIGCELTDEYIPIAEARIAAAVKRREDDTRQQSLFAA